jgi:hypothetical protein
MIIMTKYQQKRNFINKINKRIKTISNRAGVDVDNILDRMASIDGVFTNETGNGINIDTSYYTPELEKRIEKLVPTYSSLRDKMRNEMSAEDKARDEQLEAESYKSFVGPRRANTTTKADEMINAFFRFEDDFTKYKEKFYDWERSQNPVHLKSPTNTIGQYDSDVRSKMSSLGKLWNHSPDYGELANMYRELDQMTKDYEEASKPSM